jgi:hypothetical protein
MTQQELQSNQKLQNPIFEGHSQKMQECIESCLGCFQQCQETLLYCLSQGGRHSQVEHIQTLQSCSEICETSAKFMMLRSEFHGAVCEVCAKVCAACAVSCEAFSDDETMKTCAAECRRCEESCKAMAEQKH